MLTIRAMAEMGPWLLDRIDVLEGRLERCRRCKTKIKNVWVMEKQTEPRETWRIGSECGPKLEALSQTMWDSVAAPFELSLRHLTTLERIVRWERDFPSRAPREFPLGWAAAQQRQMTSILTPHQRRVMGSRAGRALTAWKELLP
jgi:hypothetical protein